LDEICSRNRETSRSVWAVHAIKREYRAPPKYGSDPGVSVDRGTIAARGLMPLNSSRPRYLARVDDAFRVGHACRHDPADAAHSSNPVHPALFQVGCVGRSTLTGGSATAAIPRTHRRLAVRVMEEMSVLTPYRHAGRFLPPMRLTSSNAKARRTSIGRR